MVSHELKRQERIQIIINSINNSKKKNKVIDIEKLIAQCCMEWGTSRRTILEYLKIINNV